MAVGPLNLTLLQSRALAIENQRPHLTEIFRAAGIVPSTEQECRIPNFGDQFLTVSADVVGAGGSFPVKRVTAELVEITIPKIGVNSVAPWEDLVPSQQALMDEAYITSALDDVLLAANAAIAAILLDPLNWSTTDTVDFSGSGNPLAGLYAQLQVVSDLCAGWWPNRLVCNRGTFTAIINHPASRERLNPTNPLSMNRELVASILDLPPDGVVIVDAHTDGGPVFTADTIWVGYVNVSGNAVSISPTAIVTPRWTAAGGSDGQPWRFRREYIFHGTDAGLDGLGPGVGDDVWLYRAEAFIGPTAGVANAGALLTADYGELL